MTFNVIDLVSPHYVRARGSNAMVQIISEPLVSLGSHQVGIVLSKHKWHMQGMTTFTGIVNPGWSGNITVEIMVNGELIIEPGDSVAHVLVFSEDGFEYSPCEESPEFPKLAGRELTWPAVVHAEPSRVS